MKVFVVDDEPLARARVIRMLEAMPDVVVVGEAQNGDEALARIPALAPDVVLLDVDMPGVDGLALAEKPGMPPVVFTTAHPQYASDAFDLDAVDYLVKPLRRERLERALDRVRRRATATSAAVDASAAQLVVHESNTVRFVDARRVTAFRALDKYTAFECDGEQMLLRESLDALESRLAPFGFVRVHRGGLVRRDAIVALDQDSGPLCARLADRSRVEVSRRYAPELRRLLGVRG